MLFVYEYCLICYNKFLIVVREQDKTTCQHVRHISVSNTIPRHKGRFWSVMFPLFPQIMSSRKIFYLSLDVYSICCILTFCNQAVPDQVMKCSKCVTQAVYVQRFQVACHLEAIALKELYVLLHLVLMLCLITVNTCSSYQRCLPQFGSRQYLHAFYSCI